MTPPPGDAALRVDDQPLVQVDHKPVGPILFAIEGGKGQVGPKRGHKSNRNSLERLRQIKFEGVERQIAETIIDAEKPLILITENAAESMSGLSSYMIQIFPDVAIIFENLKAEKAYKHARFCEQGARKNIIGHFEEVSTLSNVLNGGVPQEIEESDFVMIYGTPGKALSEMLHAHASNRYHVNETLTQENMDTARPRINWAVAKQALAERELESHPSKWRPSTIRRRSLC